MTGARTAFALALSAVLTCAPADAGAAAAARTQSEVVAAIQVHGNNVTPEAEILAAAGVSVGAAFTPDVPDAVAGRLRATGMFDGVEVRQRYASIADPSQIALVIIVDEKPVRVQQAESSGDGEPAAPRIVRRGWLGSALLLPILDGEDGYGLTYGGIVAWPGVLGGDSRLAVPLTWGGHKRAGIEVERLVAGPQRIRLRAGAELTERRNPFFDEDDGRRRVWGRAERAAGIVRGGATVAWERVSFAGTTEPFSSVGADVTVDTRINPMTPRNAAVVRAAWTRYEGERTAPFDVRGVDARGYLGLYRGLVLVGRADVERASPGAPDPFKPLLGGWATLRGYRAGAFAGDTRAMASLELRVPLSSVISSAQMGVSVFADAGRAWDHGTAFDDAPTYVGRGAGLWLAAPFFHAGLSVAHGRGSGFRVNVSLGITYE